MQRLSELRPKGLIISEEAPSTRGPLHDHFPIRLEDEFMATASGGLGFALPAAVGAALAQPDKTVFCLLGDGSAMYSIQGIWTAADLKLDVRFMIVNNGGYAALEQFGALFDMVVVGSKLPGIDFVKLAEGMGVPGARISSADDLDDAIRDLFAGTGPKLLEVVVERPAGQ
jgi:benzoylformate decarboxylase